MVTLDPISSLVRRKLGTASIVSFQFLPSEFLIRIAGGLLEKSYDCGRKLTVGCFTVVVC